MWKASNWRGEHLHRVWGKQGRPRAAGHFDFLCGGLGHYTFYLWTTNGQRWLCGQGYVPTLWLSLNAFSAGARKKGKRKTGMVARASTCQVMLSFLHNNTLCHHLAFQLQTRGHQTSPDRTNQQQGNNGKKVLVLQACRSGTGPDSCLSSFAVGAGKSIHYLLFHRGSEAVTTTETFYEIRQCATACSKCFFEFIGFHQIMTTSGLGV